MHMAKTSIGKKEMASLKMIYDALDEEKDGEIELKEFVMQFKDKFDIMIKVSEMEAIMKQCDLNQDGNIQYTEFIVACCNKRSLFTAHNIEACFNVIDADLDGEISWMDLKKFLGPSSLSEGYVKHIIEDADENGDGGLELPEFSAIMMKILISTERNR